ncbi:transposable element Tcb1 transposase [Trichonephila clavipes]|nr:transposable element Tcb1 transposase [Trichonephila clavipes]
MHDGIDEQRCLSLIVTLLLYLDEEFPAQTLRSRLAETGFYARVPVWCLSFDASIIKDRILWRRKRQWGAPQEWWRVLFSDESKYTKQSDSRRVISWRESGAHFHPSYVTKIDRFGGKGVLVCGVVMLGSRTTLYVFDVNLQRYRMVELLDDWNVDVPSWKYPRNLESPRVSSPGFGNDSKMMVITDLHVQSETMTGHIYWDVILEQHVRLFRGAMGAEFLFMDDNARPHRENIENECLQSEYITRMD